MCAGQTLSDPSRREDTPPCTRRAGAAHLRFKKYIARWATRKAKSSAIGEDLTPLFLSGKAENLHHKLVRPTHVRMPELIVRLSSPFSMGKNMV